jgi:hypothetical protein
MAEALDMLDKWLLDKLMGEWILGLWVSLRPDDTITEDVFFAFFGPISVHHTKC